MRGGLSGVHRSRYFKSDAEKVGTHDVNNLYGSSVAQFSAYAEIMFDEHTSLETILTTPDVSKIGYTVELDLKYPYKIKQRTKY